jgi:hypothetical protein
MPFADPLHDPAGPNSIDLDQLRCLGRPQGAAAGGFANTVRRKSDLCSVDGSTNDCWLGMALAWLSSPTSVHRQPSTVKIVLNELLRSSSRSIGDRVNML